MPTPWAPSQHEGMSCACPHWDAWECVRSRCPEFAGCEDDDRAYDRDERCDCRCHDVDEDFLDEDDDVF